MIGFLKNTVGTLVMALIILVSVYAGPHFIFPSLTNITYAECNQQTGEGCLGRKLQAIQIRQAHERAEAERVASLKHRALTFSDPEFWSTGYVLIYITSSPVSFAGWMLNESVTHFVLKMGSFLSPETGMGRGLNTAWTVIRDIVNLTFVFGLIYLAFMTIAQADTRKLKHGVTNIIKGALLVNFSMFFAKMIIDIANVTAITIFANMDIVSRVGDGMENKGIAWFFFERMGLLPLMKDADKIAATAAKGTKLAFDATTLSWSYSIMISLVFLITTFVFMAGAVLIAIRFIVLTLLIILSPIAFASGSLPKINTEELSHDWWGRLISHAMFAPAYFLMMWISMRIIDISSAKTLSMQDFISEGRAAPMMNFIMVAGFMIGSLIVAKKFGAHGAASAIGLGKSIAKGAGSAAGRWGIGAPSSYLLKKYESARGRDSKDMGGRFLNNVLYYTGTHAAVHGALAAGKSSRFGGSHSWESASREKSAYNQHNATHGQQHDREHAVTAGMAVMNQLNASGAVPTTEQSNAIKALASSLREMSDNERADLKVKVLANENVAMHLSDKHIEALEKNENISAGDIAKIKEARKRAFANVAKGSGAGHVKGTRDADWLGNRSTKDVAALPVEILEHKDVVGHLSPDVVKQKLEDGMSTKEKADLRTAIQKKIKEIENNPKANAIEKAYVASFKQWTEKTTYGAKFGLF